MKTTKSISHLVTSCLVAVLISHWTSRRLTCSAPFGLIALYLPNERFHLYGNELNGHYSYWPLHI